MKVWKRPLISFDFTLLVGVEEPVDEEGVSLHRAPEVHSRRAASGAFPRRCVKYKLHSSRDRRGSCHSNHIEEEAACVLLYTTNNEDRRSGI